MSVKASQHVEDSFLQCSNRISGFRRFFNVFKVAFKRKKIEIINKRKQMKNKRANEDINVKKIKEMKGYRRENKFHRIIITGPLLSSHGGFNPVVVLTHICVYP